MVHMSFRTGSQEVHLLATFVWDLLYVLLLTPTSIIFYNPVKRSFRG